MNMDARALAVKMLKETQLQTMHDRETARFTALGYYLPYQIASLAGHDSINKFWGAPDSGIGAERWCSRVSEQVRQFLSRSKLGPGDYLETLHVFDWTLWHDRRVDFRYEGASRINVPIEESF